MKSIIRRNNYFLMLLIIVSVLFNNTASLQELENSEEAKFINIIENAINTWTNAPNDIQREQIPSNRNKALCSVNKNPVSWIGNVSRIGTGFISDDVIFKIVISNNITLTSGSFLDNDGSKVVRGSKLFNQIANLTVGQRVIFSGSFPKGTDTCLFETSLTNSGSIKSPDFTFIFKDVKLQN